MSPVKIKENDHIPMCPNCGNNTEFKIYSQQVAEDYCNIWATCKCGYDPTEDDTDKRIEDVWGGTDDNNCIWAINETWAENVINTKH